MKIIKINKHESTFEKAEFDLRPFEQAWREDCPNSLPNPLDKAGVSLISLNDLDDIWRRTK
jgi:hypothetical protein